MNLLPINHRPMLVNQNMKKQSSAVNFKGYVKEETIQFIQDFAKEKFKGNENAAKQYAENIINKLKEIMKPYHPNIFLERVVTGENSEKCDCWRLAHSQCPEKAFVTTGKGTASLYNGVPLSNILTANLTSLDPKAQELDMIGSLNSAVLKDVLNGQQMNGRMVDVIDQLGKHLGKTRYYKENYVPQMKNQVIPEDYGKDSPLILARSKNGCYD